MFILFFVCNFLIIIFVFLRVFCQPNRVVSHPNTPAKDEALLSAFAPSLRSLNQDNQIESTHLRLANSGMAITLSYEYTQNINSH